MLGFKQLFATVALATAAASQQICMKTECVNFIVACDAPCQKILADCTFDCTLQSQGCMQDCVTANQAAKNLLKCSYEKCLNF